MKCRAYGPMDWVTIKPAKFKCDLLFKDETYLEFSILPGPNYASKSFYVLIFQTHGVIIPEQN